mmetsp:Transcript_25857/g.63983  ORF Transcript_25857/g.63983 Transcript_25857/m.63983 type:complete len:431 (-) Transcript_25857:1011-2303(-)
MAAEVRIFHPEGSIVLVSREVQHLAKSIGPSRGLVRPLAVPLDHPVRGVERNAQPHEPIVFKLASCDHRVCSVEKDALLRRLRAFLPLGVHGAANHMLSAQLLHHLHPQPIRRRALGRNPFLLSLLKIELVPNASGEVFEALRHRAPLHGLVRSTELGVRLLDYHCPVLPLVMMPREDWLAARVARQTIIDDDHLPVVVRVGVVAVELAHEEAFLDPRVVELPEEDAVELLAVGGDNVERRDEPSVVVAIRGLPCSHNALRCRPVVREHLRVLVYLFWPLPLRHGWHANQRGAFQIHLRLQLPLGASRRFREPARTAVLKLGAVRLTVGERVRHQVLFPLLDIVRKLLALDGHHGHVLHPLGEAELLLQLHPLRVTHRAVVFLHRADPRDVMLVRRRGLLASHNCTGGGDLRARQRYAARAEQWHHVDGA